MFNEDNLREFDAYIVGFDEEPLKKVRAIHLDDGIEYLDGKGKVGHIVDGYWLSEHALRRIWIPAIRDKVQLIKEGRKS